VGGYGEDRDTCFEDLESFLKLRHAGLVVDVLPEVLFYYRHRAGSMSRVTDPYRNQARVLRQFAGDAPLPPGEAALLWTSFAVMQRDHEVHAPRYRVAERVAVALRPLLPLAKPVGFLRAALAALAARKTAGGAPAAIRRVDGGAAPR
jgi:hypothetical protein